jgi:hypothetical protein
VEPNQGCLGSRTLDARPVAAKDIGFPFAAQATLLVREHVGRKNEMVAQIPGLPSEELNAAQRQKAHRQACGSETASSPDLMPPSTTNAAGALPIAHRARSS